MPGNEHDVYKEPYLPKINGRGAYENGLGSGSKELNGRRRRAVAGARNCVENCLVCAHGGVFDYASLSDELKVLVDWLFDGDFSADAEYQELTVNEVTTYLTNQQFPYGMGIQELTKWICGLKLAMKMPKS